MSQDNQDGENEFTNITPEKVVKAATVGAGVVGVALIAPIGIAGVVGMGLIGVAASWFTDSAGDAIKKANKK
ncbi:MAG: hypothetical protein ACK5V6_04535 [Pseudanabaena sp.]